MTQSLRALTSGEDPSLIGPQLKSSYGEPNALFWLLWTPGMNMVLRHTYKQTPIKISKT